MVISDEIINDEENLSEFVGSLLEVSKRDEVLERVVNMENIHKFI